MKDLIRWKRGFEIFSIDHYAGDIGNNNTTGMYWKTLVSVPPTLHQVSQFTKGAISRIS